jgi:hypothetical protein
MIMEIATVSVQEVPLIPRTRGRGGKGGEKRERWF